ncbi:2-deoxy-D-gluconate 3-dehydrogenase [Devosia limi DSM 17137]|uniref:2-deoxy-D-gluconate 3-dehydrogenase n=1 Tax=Devosia limi DSM 17137 TaxID=1121477 RepID=A0A0F5LWQ7_9HYPH|nr:SDR family oxidoreductase [Devosia limi]KKB86067.1 2-deoxy-D-gluconate 3-dehydrogenase [Devosia limi DSM 17137]SHF84021.1 NAD(P)-dependent dehydrogenase, short-chain alcohol dehydrogenase family [Devosia limi DSM 17137]
MHPNQGNWASQWYAGKKVVITGGSSGIGASVARAFLDAGAEVIATGVSSADIEAARQRSNLEGAQLRVLDVRNGPAVSDLFAGLDRLDILVNCAGVIQRGAELDPAVFEAVVDINLNGTMRCCAAARPLLAAGKGAAIVNLASMLSIFGGGMVPGYSASKGGISQLTKSLAIAYGPDDIRVNAVAPGWIATPLTADLQADPARTAQIMSRSVIKRWGEPEDIANGALYLCSPVARFVTGTTLVIDGGYSVG